MSIFVAVGTSHFDSLIGKMDELAPRLGEKVVMQIGLGRIQPRNAEYFRFAPSLQPYIDEASIVISQSGSSRRRARMSPISRSMAAGENRLGVPPPMKMLCTDRPQTRGSAASRSAIRASM